MIITIITVTYDSNTTTTNNNDNNKHNNNNNNNNTITYNVSAHGGQLGELPGGPELLQEALDVTCI